MYIRSFELTVMFFGITNLPAIFQAMMNKILRDLINKKKTTTFVDNILVGTETEERHDKIVNKVLRRYKAREIYIGSIQDWILRGHYRT